MTKKKLKILHVGNHTIPCVGGIEQVIWNTANGQAKMGHAVSIMVFDTCTDGKTKLESEETIEGVHIIRVPQSGFSFYRSPPRDMLIEMARKHDVVHVHGLGAWFDILADAKNESSEYKLVLTTHGGFFHTQKRGLLKWIYRTFLLPARWKKADWIFFVSANDQANFEGLDFSRSSVLGNGVDVAPLLKLSLAKKDPHQFIFVGRLSRNKRVDRLLGVFSRLVARDSRFQLHIVGPDWEGIMSELREQTKPLGIEKNIVFHGTLSSEKVKNVYEKSLFFISASEYEGFGITTIEGMAAGSIPILQTIPTFRDFAGENRGLIVDFAQPDSAAESILTFTHSTKNFSTIQRNCRAFSKQFEWKRILTTMMARLEGL